MDDVKGLPGFRDFYPGDLAVRSHVLSAWHEVARRYGFEEYDGPPLEPLEIYTRKSGEEIVEQLYEFQDKGGRPVALRPEMTPTLARMVGAHAAALRKPIRWYSMPQLYRYERQQRGRLREHFQLNMDILGESGVLADADLLAAAIDVTRVLGLDADQVRARVSDRRLLGSILRQLGVPDDRLVEVYQVVDKLDREPRERLEERLAKLGLSSSTVDGVFDALEVEGLEALRSRFGGTAEVSERLQEFELYLDHLESLGFREYVDVDLSIVRGLAYYTGIVFELWDARQDLRAICGGGRYDDLLQVLAGVEMPAVGFGMGDVVLTELLRDHGLLPEYRQSIDCYVVSIGEETRDQSLRVVRALRDAGVSAAFEYRDRSPRGQFKSADSMGASWTAVIGPEELSAGTVQLRNMESGEEEPVKIEELTRRLRGGQ